MIQVEPIKILPGDCTCEHLEKEKTSPSLGPLDWEDDSQVRRPPKQRVKRAQAPDGQPHVSGGWSGLDGPRLGPCGETPLGSPLPRLLVAASGPSGLFNMPL